MFTQRLQGVKKNYKKLKAESKWIKSPTVVETRLRKEAMSEMEEKKAKQEKRYYNAKINRKMK